MGRIISSGNLIQLGILIISGFCMLGGFWSYCEGHFAKAEDLGSEIEERRELKSEVDQLYLKLIPESEQAKLKHHPDGFGK